MNSSKALQDPHRPAIVLLAHGSKNTAWREPFDRLIADLQTDPELPVIRLAFIEHCEPLLEDVLDVLFTQKCQTIHIQPLLISGGFHLEVDVPTRLQHWRESHPEIDISLDKALLEHALMRQAIRTIIKQR